MKMECDGNYIIFTLESEFDFFTLGRAQERCKRFEYSLLYGTKLEKIRISKENILNIILQEPV